MTRMKRSLTAAALAAPLLVVACGGGSSGGGGVAGADLVITATEYKYDQPVYTVAPGTVKIALKNDGSLTHSLVIDGVPSWTKLLIPPGSSKIESVTLPAGTYKIYCDVTGHEALGMKAELDVKASAAPTTSGSPSTS